jgi:hypothetical protein
MEFRKKSNGQSAKKKDRISRIASGKIGKIFYPANPAGVSPIFSIL